jgi:hypothetical protein
MASLYQFIEEMDLYLAIKKDFKGISRSRKHFKKKSNAEN